MQAQAYAKTCCSCGQRKPLTDFYRDKGKADGRCSRCKACDREHTRRWNTEHRDQQRERSSRYYPKYAEKSKARQARFRKDNPQKVAAYVAVQRAVIRGDLVRPDACEQCGKNPGFNRQGCALIEAHHDDYSKPLDVRWLCSTCHKAHHADGISDAA